MHAAHDGNKSARILIIDDQERCAAALARILERAGYAICITITDPSVAADRLEQLSPDLILLDLHMEPISGIEVLSVINEILPARSRPPVLVLTADTTPEARHEALAAGATDFLSKPLDPTEVLLRIDHILTARSLFLQCQTYSQGLERLVERRTADLQKQTQDLERTVTELRETQHQVIQQERLRALGAMASGIAHDLNNGLTLIVGFGDILLSNSEKLAEQCKERTYVEQIVAAGHDAAQMVKRLREFYRPCAAREERQPVDVNALVDQSITLTNPKWQCQAEASGATIQIVKKLRPVPLVSGAPAELREVLTNLIFNAVDAMPCGGMLEFSTKADAGMACIEVADTGTGMTEETRRQCLEPFFTTKGESGSGLGLAMSYGIIRRHGGTISVSTRLNKGSTFTVKLPLSNDLLPEAVECGRRSVRPLRVLVVDDHPAVCEIVSAYLAEDRHIVETATGAKEALKKFRADQFDVVITDWAMPNANGNELAAAIKGAMPKEPVIMLTGFAELLKETGQSTANVDLVLSKPPQLDELRRAIFAVAPVPAG